MLDPSVLNEIRYADEGEKISFVVEWMDAPTPDLYHDAVTRKEKQVRRHRFYTVLKSPLVAKLQHAGVRVKDLPASPQAIVTCTAKQWQQLGLDGGLLDDTAVRVLPNVLFESAV